VIEARSKQSAKKLARPAHAEPQVRELDDHKLDRPAKGRPPTDLAHMTLGGLLGSALTGSPQPGASGPETSV